MARWRYKLESGKYLRQAIEEENIEDIIAWLQTLYQEINAQFPDEYDNSEVEAVCADLDDIYEDWENGDDEDDIENRLDYMLNDFYDLCDEMDIWVGI